MSSQVAALEKLDSNITLYTANYSTGEDLTELSSDDVIDCGTATVTGTNDEAAEQCVVVEGSSTHKLYNMRVWISSAFPGMDYVMKADEDALTAALETAGTAVSYSDKAPGKFSTATSVEVDVSATYQSDRIRFQPQGNNTNIGSLPYDPSKDALTYPAQLYIYYEESDYVQRWDVSHGRKPSDVLTDLRDVELFYVATIEGTERMVSLGDLSDAFTIEKSTETTEIKRGYPMRLLRKTVDDATYTISGNLSKRDWALKSLFNNYSFAYDDTNKYWKMVANEKSTLPQSKFILVGYTLGGYMRIIEFPESDIEISGGEDIFSETTDMNVNINVIKDSSNNFYNAYQSKAVAYLYALDIKYAVELS